MSNNPYENVDDPYANSDLYSSIDRAAGIEPEARKSTPKQTPPASETPGYGPQPVTGPPRHDYGSSYGTSQPNPFLQHNNPPRSYGHVPAPYRYQAGPPELVKHDGMLKANVWVSAFFPLAGVIFYFVEKGKHPHYDKYLKETLNMSLTRMIVGLGAAALPWFFSTIFGIISVVYFVLAIMGALEASNKFLRGEEMRYKGAIPFTRD